MKKYLRAKSTNFGGVENDRVVEYRHFIEWVDSAADATADYIESVEETRKKLRVQLGIDTEIEEVPNDKLMQSKWIIWRDEKSPTMQGGLDALAGKKPK
jgi:hypothetical protein